MKKKLIIGLLLVLFTSVLFSSCSVNEQCPAYANADQMDVEQAV